MFGFENRVIRRLNNIERSNVEALLTLNGLAFEGTPDCTSVVEDADGNIAATASIQGNIIKMVAADRKWQDAGLAGMAVSSVIRYAGENNIFHLFIYTKPEMANKFSSLGFRELAGTESAVLLESGHPSAREYTKMLEDNKFRGTPSTYGAIVMNCNPFTLGHRYLIETASALCGGLYVIAVEEDVSEFPFKDRIALIRKGTEDITNIRIIPSAEYAVSRATFPTYFLKDSGTETVSAIQAELDAVLFANLFAPALSLTKRFVGTEPFCPTTGVYNSVMKKVLPPRGVEVVEIERMKDSSGIAVSASRVREAIKRGDNEALKTMLPRATLDYLKSAEGLAAADKIRKTI